MFLSFLLYNKEFQWALAFWFISIILSLALGNTVASFLEPFLGFDQRFSEYLSAGSDMDVMQGFSHTGLGGIFYYIVVCRLYWGIMYYKKGK